ncbi:MAG: hypothetical protein JW822_14310 [Spirochaetales bacterium]|nr:hypothetical protein [Spirochaetales bacterium]
MRKLFFPLFLMLSLCYLFLGISQAAADNTEIGESSVQQAAELFQKGLVYYEKDFHKALEFFKQALGRDQNYINALLGAGKMTALLGNFNEAQNYLAKAEQLLKNQNHARSEKYAQYLYYKGYLYYLQEYLDKALDYFEQSRTLLDSLGKQNTELYIRVLVHGGFTYLGLNQIEKAENNVKEADSILNAAHLPGINLLKYHTTNLQGNVHCNKQEAEPGASSFKTAKSYLEKAGLTQSYDMAVINNNLGWCSYLKQQYDTSLQYYEKADALLKQLKLTNSKVYVIVMQNFAASYFQKSQLDKALDYCFKAKSVLENLKLTNIVRYANTLYFIAIIYHNQGHPSNNQNLLSAALEYYLNVKQLYDKHLFFESDMNTYRIVMHNIGKIYHVKAQAAKAEQYYKETAKIMEKQGWTAINDYGFLMYDLASLYEAKNQKDLAGTHYRKAYDAFEKAGYTGPYKEKALQNAERLGH